MNTIKTFIDLVKFRIARVRRCFTASWIKLRWYKYTCKNWQKCVELSWNQEWTLCSSKHCPIMGYNAMTRAYKKTIGEYVEEEDVLLKAGR
jgi:hypothetical protein